MWHAEIQVGQTGPSIPSPPCYKLPRLGLCDSCRFRAHSGCVLGIVLLLGYLLRG